MKSINLFIIMMLAIFSITWNACTVQRCTEETCTDCGTVVKITTLQGVSFGFNKYNLKTSTYGILEEDSDLLKEDSSLSISIEGHTDIVGTVTYNKSLSLKRAQSVYNYFLKQGIKASRMRVIGHGSDKPIVPNDTEANRAKNRRVDVKIIRK